MVMIEAMACGVPVVSYDFKCGPRDIIREGDNGLIIPEGDISALAEGICRLIQEEELRRSMSMKAQEVTTTYSEEKVMRRWITLFNSMAR